MRVKTLAALSCWVAVSSFSGPAAPCGAFMARATKTVPSLSVEQTLIVFDPEQELEHFVRQIAIRAPSPGFGFVVPVPERPTVAKVTVDPFAKLAAKFPVARPTKGLGLRPGSAGGGMGAAARAPVTVLSRETVGSFTAFVLAASDTKALQKWFSDNQLVVPPEAEAWLAHYVKLDFFFVALRYETQTKDAASKATRAETIRISFKTPLPFYPYREPQHAPADAELRELAVWLISKRKYTPVSLFSPAPQGSEKRPDEWQRPLAEHRSLELDRTVLEGVLSDELLKLLPVPSNSAERLISLQVFEDQKRSRRGFGDIVMVPQQQMARDALRLARSRRLMASLDPEVRP